MLGRGVIAIAVALGVMCTPAGASATGPRPVLKVTLPSAGIPEGLAGTGALPPRPDHADWLKIKTAAGLRRLALAPHRTSHFRAVAAQLGLSTLVSVHPLAPGRCRTAVTDLYDNLLDLENAYPGEDWAPLRHAVATEPSIDVCAPRPRRHPTR